MRISNRARYYLKRFGGVALAITVATRLSPAWACDIGGKWNSTFGTLTIVQFTGTDTTISGAFETTEGVGYLDGKLNGSRFDFTWARPPTFAGPNQAGSGFFEASSACDAIMGRVTYRDAAIQEQTWHAERMSAISFGELSPSS